jgi:hypothetical protein
MPKSIIVIEDVGGSFKRFLRQAPKVARAHLAKAVKDTTEAVRDHMARTAPVGPDAPHIAQEQEAKSRGLRGQAGILDNDHEAHIALFNEYAPNKQPFMMPAAFSQEQPFANRGKAALQAMEAELQD